MTWLTLALIFVSLALGCGERVLTQWPRKTIFSTYFREQEVKLGMSREEVEGVMGPPQVREEGDYRGGHFVLYFYLVGKGRRDYLKAVDRSWSEHFAPPAPAPTQTIYQRRTW
jgi:hypothetical protein